jgi:hypothetical protein
MENNMADLKDVITNIENVYNSNNSLNLLKDFERVIDELDVYVYANWQDGELLEGPKENRYFVECTFMWPKKDMPEPAGGKRLIEYGCKVAYAESALRKVRKIKSPEDIRPGTRKGKIDIEEVWLVKIMMPKRLMKNVDRGYSNLDKNKVQDVLTQGIPSTTQPVEQQAAAEETPSE